jgi:DNA-binding transcriptional regulator YdaS (Cro superfamily)
MPTSLTQIGLSVTRGSRRSCSAIVDVPQVPVERKAVHGDDVDVSMTP